MAWDWLKSHFRGGNGGSPGTEGPGAMPATPGRAPSSAGDRVILLFQHHALREAAFSGHPELTRMPRGPLGVAFYWAKALTMADALDRIEQIRVEVKDYPLRVTVESRETGEFRVDILTFPVPTLITECYFVGIANRTDEAPTYPAGAPSTRYFTLERSAGPEPMLCEWTRDGTHLNFGRVSSIRIDDFLTLVARKLTSPVPG